MQVFIVGAGNVGTFIAAELSGDRHDVTVIEDSPARVAGLEGRHGLEDVKWVAADACEVSNLQHAGLSSADVVVAVTGDDQVNLVVSLLAKQEFAVPRVVARVNHPENEWLFNETWGVDVSVSTPHLLTALVEEAVSVGSLVRLLSFEGGRARLVEVKLADDAPALGQELVNLGFPRDSTVVAIVRGDRVVVPRGDTVFHPRDEVLVLVTDESEPQVRELLVANPKA
jgi:trk system potassium uptake protein TrkA